ncbi:MAG: addiction module toxin RelE [Treponema sp. GWB1_62_6]|nr:MAG: addiction module toxin RelE [Treponema sp. GWA1_62_8]OHE63548.1 MAG: addiction module toxin RelE [Treponema sp. GWC1_61_84]OHE70848.1 MAG: addiction module toxin RelE [Treponema sp. GWB1_62_6]HCM28723.1 addiction module toxin RelE [Treponema sp.]
MTILQTPTFARAVKRLHPNQKADLDAAVRLLLEAPEAGELKKGDLAGIRVYKFRISNQITLLAYTYVERILMFTLLALGAHENFYRDIK